MRTSLKSRALHDNARLALSAGFAPVRFLRLAAAYGARCADRPPRCDGVAHRVPV